MTVIKCENTESFEKLAIFSETRSTIIIIKHSYLWHTSDKWIGNIIVLTPIGVSMNCNMLNQNSIYHIHSKWYTSLINRAAYTGWFWRISKLTLKKTMIRTWTALWTKIEDIRSVKIIEFLPTIPYGSNQGSKERARTRTFPGQLVPSHGLLIQTNR